jgi:23S rRNA pseudouridine1911/1915/1917 synthase
LPPQPTSGELKHWVQKNDAAQRMEVVPAKSRGAQEARLTYKTLGTENLGTLVEIQLLTGRKHQIRLQMSAIGCPILGDRKYGARQAFQDGAIALHCVHLAIDHPTTNERMQFTAHPPPARKLRAR